MLCEPETRRSRVSLYWLLLALLLLADSATQSTDAGESKDPTARLLVKCRRADVDGVLEALADRVVQVYDLDAMKRLVPPVPPSGPATQRPGASGLVPAYFDAREVMAAALAAVRSLRKDDSYLPRVIRLQADADELRMEVLLSTDGDPTKLLSDLRLALYLAPVLSKRGKVQVHGGEDPRRVQVAVPFTDVSVQRLVKPVAITDRAGALGLVKRCGFLVAMSVLLKGEVKYGPSVEGFLPASRGITFAPASLEQLEKLMFNVTQVTGDQVSKALTVSGVFWELLPEAENGEPPYERIGASKMTISYWELLPK